MSVVRSIYSIVKSPLVTEKSARDSVFRKYAFEVDKTANKVQIKRAIEKIYSVKIVKTSVLTVKGKLKKLRHNQAGKTASWKKAIVTLKEGFEIKIV